MNISTSYNDTHPTRPAVLLDDSPTMLVAARAKRGRIPGLHPLALIGAMIVGALMWGAIFFAIHLLIQWF